MSAEEVFQSFNTFRHNSSRAHVILAFEDESAGLLFQRLTLTDAVSNEFMNDALEAFADGENFSLTKYEAGYKPEDYELCYLSLDESEPVRQVVDSVAQSAANFDDIELFKGKEDVIDNLRFYVVTVEANSVDGGSKQALFFRTFTPKNELTRSGWRGLIQRGDYYNQVEEKIFMFDEQSDCLAWKEYVFIKNVTQFQKIFQYFEVLQAKANEVIASVELHLPISNFDEFKKACLGNLLMLSKLAQISRKPYLATVTMDDIKQTIKDFGLPIEIKKEGDLEKLVFERSPSKRWLILKLLGDDYLGSTMTKLKYSSTSKIQM